MLTTKSIVAALLIAVALPTIVPQTAAAQGRGGLAERRIAERQRAKRQEYFRCASFSVRVLNACLEQNRNNPQSQRSCRTHYQRNIVSCQQANR